jgi:hypothetical protein
MKVRFILKKPSLLTFYTLYVHMVVYTTFSDMHPPILSFFDLKRNCYPTQRSLDIVLAGE